MLRYTVLLQKNAEVPGYWVMVPELPGCFSQGETLEEALANAKEAIECHLEGLAVDGEELPVEQEPFIVASVLVEAPKAPEEPVTAFLKKAWETMGGTSEAKIGPGWKLTHPEYHSKWGVTFIETRSDLETFKRFYCLRLKDVSEWKRIYQEIAKHFELDIDPKGVVRAWGTQDLRVLRRFLEISLEHWKHRVV